MSYAAATALAKRLLGKKGREVTIVRRHGGTINKTAGTRAAGDETPGTFKCVGLPPGKSAEKEIGSLVGRRVMEFHLSRVSGDLEPQPGDFLDWVGTEWPLIWVASYDPDGSGLVYSKAYGEIGG